MKTIQTFTDKIKAMGPHEAMRQVAADGPPVLTSATGAAPFPSDVRAAGAIRASTAAVGEALTGGKIKALVGWTRMGPCRGPGPAWILSAEATGELVAPGKAGNLARLLKNPRLKASLPLGVVARRNEVLALNVLAQEVQIDPAKIILFTVAEDGKYFGHHADLAAATAAVMKAMAR